jgi:DNA-binding protein HU-beta
MNKGEFVTHIAKLHSCTKLEAEKVVDMFTSSVIDAIYHDKEISLIGFGQFTTSKVAAKTGRNPKTQQPMEIAAYTQVKFKVGQKLKDACNHK